MFRTEIVLDGICYRIICGSREEAVEAAREVARMACVDHTGGEKELTEALMDDDNVSWVDVALPVVTADQPTCPECDVMGSFSTGDTSDWCEACGYDSSEEE